MATLTGGQALARQLALEGLTDLFVVPGVQLDAFPTALLESLTIRKTFTPEVQGDWAGGLMDITTQDFPSRFQVRAGITLVLPCESTYWISVTRRTVDMSVTAGSSVPCGLCGTIAIAATAKGSGSSIFQVFMFMISSRSRPSLSWDRGL